MMNTLENSREIAALVECGEANAYLDMFEAAPEAFAAENGIKIVWIGSTPVITSENNTLILLNRALSIGLGEPLTESLTNTLVEYLKNTTRGNFALQVSPEFNTPEVPIWLEKCGMKLTNRWMKAYRDAAPPPAYKTNFCIEQIGVENAFTFMQTFSAAYGLSGQLIPWMAQLIGRPRWSHYMAFDGSQPIGTGALFVKDGVGWLGFGGTLPVFRRCGIQRAIIARRLQDGIAAGCHWFVSETDDHNVERPNPSFRNLLSAGFRLAYARPNYEFQLADLAAHKD